MATGPEPSLRLTLEEFAAFLADVRRLGFTLLGPTLVQGDFVHREIAGVADLPRGVGMVQEAGTFRLVPRGDEALFGYPVGQPSWKPVFFPPERLLWTGRRTGRGWEIRLPPEDREPVALLGVRPCDLAALEVLDRIFLHGPYVDPYYQAQRNTALVVAVNCTVPGGTCFCASLGTGPRAAAGFDVALTEMLTGDGHWFLAEAGSDRGRRLLSELPGRPARPEEEAAASQALAQAAGHMGRSLKTAGLKEDLYARYEHRHWAEVAARCLTCGNCAMVCPTCFCHLVEDSLNLTGDRAERRRIQDVCFTVAHSYIHGGSVRSTPRARYRQWLTHKLATWQDQFGCLDCVGCGRCITWCPVGIDLTAEVTALRVPETPGPAGPEERHDQAGASAG
ncbi:MAG: 4Fe-4S dicluster domain-containing protein [Syntrophobacterales bacterium]|nr:4Fe-4S dicluster domain-containing protein [Syntrophobacterales bacterium]